MPIPVAHANRYIYHFSHIDNLPNLLCHGFLATNHDLFPAKHRSIAAGGIQARRSKMQVTCGPKGCVHDYIPLYFGSVSPMLLSVVNTKNVDQCDILYFEFPISMLEEKNAVFTDASANTAIPPNFYDDPNHLAELDWSAIDSMKWGGSDDFRHRRMAEVLIYNHLPMTAAARCVVWNESVKERVQAIVGMNPFPPIEFQDQWNRRHWFTSIERNDGSSVVIGPNEIASIFEATCEYVEKNSGKNFEQANFKNLQELLLGLRGDFGCLPHTAELVGLSSANGIHRRPVDVHTKEVVAGLLKLEGFKCLSSHQQMLLELAAYLHDIGKGPSSRWVRYGGLQQVDPDHPVGAMPMLAEILTKHVGLVDQLAARQLLKIVCYHDLVGDVLGNGRDEQQIRDVVDDVDELNMLFLLAQADIESLVPWWWDVNKAEALYERCA